MPGFRVLALSWPPDPMSHAPSIVSYLLGTGMGSEEGVGRARKFIHSTAMSWAQGLAQSILSDEGEE